MCKNPSRLDAGSEAEILIGCRDCWECKLLRVNDLVGRAMAERAVSSKTFFLTLTYGRGNAGEVQHQASTILTYRHVQLFLKRLRNKGYSVRYMASGEYGKLRQRAHWHLLLFFTGKFPNWKIDQRIDVPEWSDEDGKPRGFIHVKNVDYRGMKYCAKYILKDDDGSQSRMSYSRFPPLGEGYFRWLALETARRGIQPISPHYKFEVPLPRGGKRTVMFRMRGVTLQRFMEVWAAEYARLGFGFDEGGVSEMVQAFYRYGKVVNYELAEPYYLDKLYEESRLNARFDLFEKWRLEAEAKALECKTLSARYKSAYIASDLGAFFWVSIRDVKEQGEERRQACRAILADCRSVDPAFNPFSAKWAKTHKRFGVQCPAGVKLDCDRVPSSVRARERKLVARVRRLFDLE